jgi:hypothetical protein
MQQQLDLGPTNIQAKAGSIANIVQRLNSIATNTHRHIFWTRIIRPLSLLG